MEPQQFRQGLTENSWQSIGNTFTDFRGVWIRLIGLTWRAVPKPSSRPDLPAAWIASLHSEGQAEHALRFSCVTACLEDWHIARIPGWAVHGCCENYMRGRAEIIFMSTTNMRNIFKLRGILELSQRKSPWPPIVSHSNSLLPFCFVLIYYISILLPSLHFWENLHFIWPRWRTPGQFYVSWPLTSKRWGLWYSGFLTSGK